METRLGRDIEHRVFRAREVALSGWAAVTWRLRQWTRVSLSSRGQEPEVKLLMAGLEKGVSFALVDIGPTAPPTLREESSPSCLFSRGYRCPLQGSHP